MLCVYIRPVHTYHSAMEEYNTPLRIHTQTHRHTDTQTHRHTFNHYSRGNRAQYRIVMKYLSELTEEQTLLLYSGHPLGCVVLYCVVLCCIVLYCVVLCCVVLCCVVDVCVKFCCALRCIFCYFIL